MTSASGQTDKLRGASALIGWASAIAARFSRANGLRVMERAEFEQIARSLNLSSPEIYGLLTGRQLSADAPGECLAAELETSPQLAKQLRAIERNHRVAVRMSVPIAPCCC